MRSSERSTYHRPFLCPDKLAPFSVYLYCIIKSYLKPLFILTIWWKRYHLQPVSPACPVPFLTRVSVLGETIMNLYSGSWSSKRFDAVSWKKKPSFESFLDRIRFLRLPHAVFVYPVTARAYGCFYKVCLQYRPVLFWNSTRHRRSGASRIRSRCRRHLSLFFLPINYPKVMQPTATI